MTSFLIYSLLLAEYQAVKCCYIIRKGCPMMRMWNVVSWPINCKLFLLFAIIFIPSAGIIITSSIDRRGYEINEARRETLVLAEILAVQQDQIAGRTKQMLTTLSHIHEVQTMDVEVCNVLFRELVDTNPFYSALSLISLDGDLIASSTSFIPGSVNISDHKHFQDAVTSLNFSVGEFRIGLVTKKPTLHYAYPVFDDRNKLVAILAVGFRLDDYEQLLTKAHLPENSVVVLADRQGRRLYRQPTCALVPAGSTLSNDVFQRVSGSDVSGTYERKGDDYIERIYSFKQVRIDENSKPYLYMIVGVYKKSITQKINLNMMRDLYKLTIITVIAASLAWFFGNKVITRPILKIAKATRDIAEGDMSIRINLSSTSDELGQLAASFDIMAETLGRKSLKIKDYTEKLERSNQDLTEFAFIASHDLQEPLRKVKMFAHMLKQNCGDSLGEKGNVHLDKIIDANHRMQTLLKALLEYAKLSRSDLTFNEVDLNKVILEVLSDLEINIQMSGGEVYVANFPTIQANSMQMRQLFQNLISNALKFRKEDVKPIITISNSTDFDTIKITIQDNGIGFGEEYVDKIFVPFQRLHNRRTYEGTGIGLAICRKIVEYHHGFISATSKENEGATFTIVLPKVQP